MSNRDQAADDRTAELLTQALSDEAGSVEPAPGGLQAIQRRTAATKSSRSPWLAPTVGGGLATAAVIAAVVVGSQGDGAEFRSRAPAASEGGQTGTPTQPEDTTVVQEPTMHDGAYDPDADPADQFTMYYVGPAPTTLLNAGQGRADLAPRLYAETHTVAEPGDDPVLTALNEFLTSRPIDPDYRSGWPEGTYATGITEADGVVTIDLAGDQDAQSMGIEPHPSPSGYTQTEAVALQGLIATIGTDEPVSFTYNGEAVDLLLLQDVSSPVSRAADDDVRAFITIDNIVDGQTVSGDVVVTISGNVFEGTVNWALLDADGKNLDDGFTTTAMGMWVQADIDLGQLAPGDYTFKALEYSAEDGSPINVDTKRFTVE